MSLESFYLCQKLPQVRIKSRNWYSSNNGIVISAEKKKASINLESSRYNMLEFSIQMPKMYQTFV